MLNGYTKQAQQYKQQEIQTATPEELLLMLYDGAIRFLVIAKNAMADQSIEKAHNNLLKAQRIIVEFMISLNFEVGGEVSQNLYNLYEYLHYRLVQANIKKDPAMVDEVLGHLRELRKTWEQAIKIAQDEQAKPSDSSAQPSLSEEDPEELVEQQRTLSA